jgi:hypothetical protein
VAQGVGPGFKPQYHKKLTENNEKNGLIAVELPHSKAVCPDASDFVLH